MSHEWGCEGVRKVPKKCLVLFEWPIEQKIFIYGLNRIKKLSNDSADSEIYFFPIPN